MPTSIHWCPARAYWMESGRWTGSSRSGRIGRWVSQASWISCWTLGEAIAATEQIKAAMGVDLPAIARRLEQAETMRPAPAGKTRVTDGSDKGKGTA